MSRFIKDKYKDMEGTIIAALIFGPAMDFAKKTFFSPKASV